MNRTHYRRMMQRARNAGADDDQLDELRAEANADRTCTLCGGELRVLGTLGQRDHFRCRECGAESNTITD